MIFAIPPVDAGLKAKLDALDDLRAQLGDAVGRSQPWLGRLRRQMRGSSAQSSVSIEGFRVSDSAAATLVAGERSPASGNPDELAVACYGRAMEHVTAMSDDPAFRWLDRVILDLHFDACAFQADKSPGRWRTDPIGVTSPDGVIAYRGSDAASVVGLMDEVVDWLESGAGTDHVAVRAAMAHLHVVSVHPFRDGNGRIARIVQSLVLAREGLLAPELGSIEEYLAGHTAEYYAALGQAQGGSYQPDRDASEWVEFCVDAHLHEAGRRVEQIERAGRRWRLLEDLAGERGWPDRLVIAMEQSLFDGTDRARYVAESGASAPTASTDLRRLRDAGLVEQRGRGRNIRYVASARLRELVAPP